MAVAKKVEKKEKTEIIKEEKPKTAEKDVIYKYMDIAGTMVRVSDKVLVNFLPYEKNPLQVINNEEVKSIDGFIYPISILQEHSFKVLSEQTKPPRWIEFDEEGNIIKETVVKHQGKITLKKNSGVLGKGTPKSKDEDIIFIN